MYYVLYVTVYMFIMYKIEVCQCGFIVEHVTNKLFKNTLRCLCSWIYSYKIYQ